MSIRPQTQTCLIFTVNGEITGDFSSPLLPLKRITHCSQSLRALKNRTHFSCHNRQLFQIYLRLVFQRSGHFVHIDSYISVIAISLFSSVNFNKNLLWPPLRLQSLVPQPHPRPCLPSVRLPILWRAESRY